MSGSTRPSRGRDENRARLWRGAIMLCIAAQVLIYLYLYVYIGRHANPKGDGMEWVAIMPATFILLLGAGPAYAMRSRTRRLPLALLLACIGVALNAAFFFEIAREFGQSAHR